MTEPIRNLRGWLLQILHEPSKNRGSKLEKLSEAFAFGGGGSGLTEEGKNLVYSLFSFDYMGSAEYEFGALPEALARIASFQKDLWGWEHIVPKEHIVGHKWERGRSGGVSAKKFLSLPKIEDVTCYCIGRKQEISQITKIITALAAEEQQCKEYPKSSAFFDPIHEWDHRVKGWVDVTKDGGFFIFKDKEMWIRTMEAFGAKRQTHDKP